MTKRGRPVKEDAKRGKFQFRMGLEEETMLNFICKTTGETKAEVLRRGLKSVYNLEKTRKYWS